MSDNMPGNGDYRRRLADTVTDEQQEIQDWLNGPGGMVVGAIVILVVIFGLVSLVVGG